METYRKDKFSRFTAIGMLFLSLGVSRAGLQVGTEKFDIPTVVNVLDSTNVDVDGNFPEGQISFARKVSSEDGFDFLKFSIDGVLTDEWSGDVSWDTVTFQIPGGDHIFEWIYEKDSSASSGDDTTWIDDVSIGPMP